MEHTPSPLEQISDPLFEEKNLEVFIKRDDLIHPHIMGNKWRKLKYNVQYAKDHNLKGIVTFGGAYSNHIGATAAACKENNLQSVGIIRGDELNANSNPTLQFATQQGMELRFVTRSTYREFTQNPDSLQEKYIDYHIVPEGGTNELAIKGCEEIIDEINVPFDYVITSVGTGGTMAGMIKALKGNSQVVGIMALKGQNFHHSFQALLDEFGISHSNFSLWTDWHFGGYAKVPPELIEFINLTKQTQGILFDPVYTAKMYFAVKELIKKDYFHSNSRIILLHTGGLQGILGVNLTSKIKIIL